MAGGESIPRLLTSVVTLVCILGAVCTAAAIQGVLMPAAAPYHSTLLMLTVAFLALAPWSVHLPDGSHWRPGMAIVTSTLFLLPPELGFLVALPGLTLMTALAHGPWWKYPLTYGHTAAALYCGAALYHWLAPAGPLHLPAALPAILGALLVHFLINHLLWGAIVAHRERRTWGLQLKLILAELNWAILGLYLLAITIALLFQTEGVWGLLIACSLLSLLYRSVAYYSRMQTWQEAALTDALTGVGNRAAWETFAMAIRAGKVMGTVAILDLNNFKAVNDERGHMAGDALLRELAASLQADLRKTDRLFRFGGDEFVLFMAHHPDAGAAVRARIGHLIVGVNQSWQRRGLSVSASVGMVTLSEHPQQFDELFALADSRMYQTKAEQKARAR